MLVLFSSGDELMDAVKNDTQQTLAEDAMRKKCIQFTTLTALCLNSIPYSNEKRVQGTLGITMQA